MCKRPKWVILACGIFAVALTWPLLTPREPEPSYQGQSLGQLILRYHSADAAESRQAADGISRIGTNAIPCLLRWMQQEAKPEPGWITTLRIKSATLIGKDMLPRHKVSRTTLAVRAFGALGPDADAAIDPLTHLMNQSPVGNAQIAAAYALAYIKSPRAIAPLICAITNEQAAIRGYAISSLRHAGTNARPVVPMLVECLKSQDNGIATVTAYSLGELKLEPKIVVPGLISAIPSADTNLSCVLMDVLGAYGKNARPATPLLVAMLHHPDESVRFHARQVLTEIAPEVLTNAPAD